MKYAITTTTHMEKMTASSFKCSGGSATLTFGDILNNTMLHVPLHVAEATAGAFNRAMQAEPQPCGDFKYEPPGRDAWFISRSPIPGLKWRFQNDEITGDGDPYWMTGEAASIMDAMDQIDELVEEHSCPVCLRMVGERKLNDFEDGSVCCWDCWDCDEKHQEEQAQRAADAEADRADDLRKERTLSQ